MDQAESAARAVRRRTLRHWFRPLHQSARLTSHDFIHYPSPDCDRLLPQVVKGIVSRPGGPVMWCMHPIGGVRFGVPAFSRSGERSCTATVGLSHGGSKPNRLKAGLQTVEAVV